MARSTFDGPILAGSNRFGALRNVGYTDISQLTTIVLTNTTNGTAGYGGGSGQFVNGNTVPNVNAVVYTPSATAYPPTAATITADSGSAGSGTLYRGIVFYLPYGSNINDFLIDTNVAITATGGTIGTVSVQIGNTFNNTTYGSVTSANAATGRNTITQTGAQLGNTKAANEFVLQVAKAQLQRDINQRNFYDDWYKNNKTYDGAETAWYEGQGGKSLFDQPALKKYKAEAQAEPAVPQKKNVESLESIFRSKKP